MLAERATCFAYINSLYFKNIFNDFLETNYLGIYWTDFHDDFFTKR